jgi:hypothetical protein
VHGSMTRGGPRVIEAAATSRRNCCAWFRGVRRLAFDRTLPPPEAMGRIRDAFADYDHQAR